MAIRAARGAVDAGPVTEVPCTCSQAAREQGTSVPPGYSIFERLRAPLKVFRLK
jgi:hypothetical protein